MGYFMVGNRLLISGKENSDQLPFKENHIFIFFMK